MTSMKTLLLIGCFTYFFAPSLAEAEERASEEEEMIICEGISCHRINLWLRQEYQRNASMQKPNPIWVSSAAFKVEVKEEFIVRKPKQLSRHRLEIKWLSESERVGLLSSRTRSRIERKLPVRKKIDEVIETLKQQHSHDEVSITFSELDDASEGSTEVEFTVNLKDQYTEERTIVARHKEEAFLAHQAQQGFIPERSKENIEISVNQDYRGSPLEIDFGKPALRRCLQAQLKELQRIQSSHEIDQIIKEQISFGVRSFRPDGVPYWPYSEDGKPMPYLISLNFIHLSEALPEGVSLSREHGTDLFHLFQGDSFLHLDYKNTDGITYPDMVYTGRYPTLNIVTDNEGNCDIVTKEEIEEQLSEELKIIKALESDIAPFLTEKALMETSETSTSHDGALRGQ